MAQPVTAILGLGREVGDAVARRFSEQGHRVIAADPRADRLEAAKSAMPDDVILHHSELHTRLGLRNVMAAAEENFGHIDNMVVIPDIEANDTLFDFSMDKFDKAIAHSSRSAALVMRSFADRLSEQEDEDSEAGVERSVQRGTVTFILSYLAEASMPGQFTASIMHSTILNVMRAGALELAELGIRANAIVAIRPREMRMETFTQKRTPLGRAALADEIADAARFLASPEAAIITGETLVMDGGRRHLSGILGD